MIDKIKNIFLSRMSIGSEIDSDPAKKVERAKVAVCALLIEIASFDGNFDEEERKVIFRLVQEKLSKEEAEELIEIANKERENSIGLWQFTREINERYSKEYRILLLEMFWEVVFADGRLHGHEDYLIHQLAELLNLEHKDLISAKIRVKESI